MTAFACTVGILLNNWQEVKQIYVLIASDSVLFDYKMLLESNAVLKYLKLVHCVIGSEHHFQPLIR